ncbi:WXG100 family type VII secretion target [Streptomyces sp. NBC_00328]|uniref:WXG100 family type VII secretion target n=1 Tax=Streptomyces sp. NBC_00328 TaxID=2903646 RepID=UPI002E2A5F3E|nr:WXG100 family type VII secretion target [Streptomyces sp. NBC_00328]
MSEDFTDGIIHVDYAHMDNAAEDMVEQTKAVGKTLESLEMELNELRKSWEGEDADVYREKQQAWDHAFQQMGRILSEHAALLTDISGHYRYTAGSLAQQWSDIRIGR